jgi:hypothetical protein
MEVQLAFAKRRRDGPIVGVKDVANGLQCDCVCPCCELEVIAAQGPMLAWHFKHSRETSCTASHESILHLFAKQVVGESPRLTLPPDPDLSRNPVTMLDVAIEVRLDEGNMIADLVCTTLQDEAIAVEVFVTHRRVEKREAYARLGLAAIEIDLSPYRDERDEDQGTRGHPARGRTAVASPGPRGPRAAGPAGGRAARAGGSGGGREGPARGRAGGAPCPLGCL